MILRYANKTADREKIWKKLRTESPFGIHYIKTFSAAGYLKERGFGVSLIRSKDPIDTIKRSVENGCIAISMIRELPHLNGGHAVLAVGVDEHNVIVHNPLTTGYDKISNGDFNKLCEPLPDSVSEIAPRTLVLVSITKPKKGKFSVFCNCGIEEDIETPISIYGDIDSFIQATELVICTGCESINDISYLATYAPPAPL